MSSLIVMAQMNTLTVVLIVLAAIVVIGVIYYIATYNALIRSKNTVEEAFATMDVYLKKRWDMIPNLVETVKGYASHESDTLERIIGLRNSAYSSMSNSDKVEAGAAISKAIPKILALAENYPDLKANANFINLSNQLEKVEADIANARKYYNAVVKEFNIKISVFPNNIVASSCGYTKQELFEIAEGERENVQVKF